MNKEAVLTKIDENFETVKIWVKRKRFVRSEDLEGVDSGDWVELGDLEGVGSENWVGSGDLEGGFWRLSWIRWFEGIGSKDWVG